VIFLLLISRATDEFHSLVLCAISCSVILPIANGYTLLVFVIPLLHLVCFREQFNVFFLGLLVTLNSFKQIPLDFGPFEDNVHTFGSLLPSLVCFVFVLFSLSNFRKSFDDSGSPDNFASDLR
jgi:hypothetical protein